MLADNGLTARDYPLFRETKSIAKDINLLIVSQKSKRTATTEHNDITGEILGKSSQSTFTNW